jgi:nucleoside-diphosphate-sugar epimerase
LTLFAYYQKQEFMKTVVVTGGTGYIGSWLVKYLLEDGYTVRITVRDLQKKYKYDFLEEIAIKSKGKLEVFEADLLLDGSFDKAMEGAETLFHVASPFMLSVKDAQKQLVDPALKGTENVLTAVNKSDTITKVVLTSSVAAVHGDNVDMKEKNLEYFDESNWNSSSSLNHQPYSYSKTVAEQKAWEIANSQDRWQLLVINPSFVMGPALASTSDSESLKFLKDILSGKMSTGAPDLMFGFVDVRDVAKAHVLADQNEKAEGRNILVERTMNVLEMAKIIAKAFPGKYKLPRNKAPKFLMYVVGKAFGVTSRFISRNVGHNIAFDASKSRKLLGLEYTPMDKSLEDMVRQIQES